jgi:hypothetical protein
MLRLLTKQRHPRTQLAPYGTPNTDRFAPPCGLRTLGAKGGSGGCCGARGRFGVLNHLQSEVEHCVLTAHSCSEVELGASPVATGHVVSDFVVSAVSDPVGQGTVLLDLLGVASLLAESLDGTHFYSSSNYK